MGLSGDLIRLDLLVGDRRTSTPHERARILLDSLASLCFLPNNRIYGFYFIG
jgi:hypothetical protein